jgi:(p)ppGpp synthase/HD superfamily hydrolase
MITLADVDRIAAKAHARQADKNGAPYVDHVRAVAHGLAAFGSGLQMAALLHDALEDLDFTGLTAHMLLGMGVPAAVVSVVERVTNQEGVSYDDTLRGITTDYAATLVKIADNAHNTHPARTGELDPEMRERLAAKYAMARGILRPAVPREDLTTILKTVNPSLLTLLDES